ncbi:hypothetical protein [Gemmatimonas groenlandica]|uniref:Uncharacterized protein n=1 Tax=Gemmatimonas groenlandica TaxID=2732249 RepID=A0A6M4ITE2_9BACT|nr:hypothetical protein [Gemmatimonas groenlandica]QJR37930.1 hypothetical protein HKW67_21570 [Gemmatimonas groenlandica]
MTGIDVVIKEEFLMVDDDFRHFIAEVGAIQWLPESPPCRDITMVTSGKKQHDLAHSLSGS